MTFSINDTRLNDNAIMLSAIHAECHILFIAVLHVVMLNAIMLNVVVLLKYKVIV